MSIFCAHPVDAMPPFGSHTPTMPHIGRTLQRLAEAARVHSTSRLEQISGVSRRSIANAYRSPMCTLRPGNLAAVLAALGSDTDDLIRKAAVEWDPLDQLSIERLRLLEATRTLGLDELRRLASIAESEAGRAHPPRPTNPHPAGQRGDDHRSAG